MDQTNPNCNLRLTSQSQPGFNTFETLPENIFQSIESDSANSNIHPSLNPTLDHITLKSTTRKKGGPSTRIGHQMKKRH